MVFPNIGRLSAIGENGLAGRFAKQNIRMQNGVMEGSLSSEEQAHLRQDTRVLTSLVKNDTADGVIGPQERADLRTFLNDRSTEIFQFRHNA